MNCFGRVFGAATSCATARAAEKFNAENPVRPGADCSLSAAPPPCPDRVQVTGHVLAPAVEADDIRIRIDTSGGQFEPPTAPS